MTGFEQHQSAFATALRDPSRLPPDTVAGPALGGSRRRFNIYRNNVYAGLVGVLEARYPAVQRLIGEEFFGAMARLFIDAAPPRSPVLLDYGQEFPEFLEAFEPVSDLPYLPDVARLEWRMHVARHAADKVALRIGDLATFGEGAADLRMRLAPAVSLLSSTYPVFSLWRANTAPAPESGPATFVGVESVLVSRPFLAPEAVRVPYGCALFIAALLEDKTLGAAASLALEAQPDFPLSRAVALLIAQKAIVSVVSPSPQQEDVRS